MKFKELKERLSKMSGSKLTGQELSVYYRENPLAKKAARDPLLKKAIEFALDHGGAMNYAIKNIEKMKRGISRHPQVQQALQFANESVNEKMLKPTSPKMRLQMAIAIALEMGGAMTPAVKKIEKIEKGLSDHPAVAYALRVANEAVNEKMSAADKKKRLQMIARAVEKMKDRELKMAKKDALAAIKALESVNEGVNGMTGKKVRLTYRPQRQNSNQFGKGLSSHSTIETSDLYQDIKNNEFELRDDCNSIAIRVPDGRAKDKNRTDWLNLINSVKPGGNITNMIRSGPLTKAEAKELFGDMKKAAKAFGGKVNAQSHEISISNYGGKLNIDKGLNAMLKAIDEFGMRNHVSVSRKEGVLTRIQDAGYYGTNESVNEGIENKERQLNYKLKELEYKMKLKDFMDSVVNSKLPKKNEYKHDKKKKMAEADTVSLKITDTSSTAFNKLSKIARDIGIEFSRQDNHLLASGDAKKMEEFKAQMDVAMKESVQLQEGTWAIPDSYPKLVALQKFLRKPHKARTAKEVFAFHNEADNFFGDDTMSDHLGAYYDIMPGGDVDPYDGKKQSPEEYKETVKRVNDYYKRNPQARIKKGSDLNFVLMKALTDWTGGVLKFKGNEIVQMPRDWYMKDNPEFKKDDSPIKAKLNADVDVDNDDTVKEAPFKRRRGNLRMKRQPAIQVESKKTFSDIKNELIEMSMKDIVRKHKRELQKAVRTGNLELPMDVENDLYQWALNNGEVVTDDPDEFIGWLDNNLDDIVKGRIR